MFTSGVLQKVLVGIIVVLAILALVYGERWFGRRLAGVRFRKAFMDQGGGALEIVPEEYFKHLEVAARMTTMPTPKAAWRVLEQSRDVLLILAFPHDLTISGRCPWILVAENAKDPGAWAVGGDGAGVLGRKHGHRNRAAGLEVVTLDAPGRQSELSYLSHRLAMARRTQWPRAHCVQGGGFVTVALPDANGKPSFIVAKALEVAVALLAEVDVQRRGKMDTGSLGGAHG